MRHELSRTRPRRLALILNAIVDLGVLGHGLCGDSGRAQNLFKRCMSSVSWNIRRPLFAGEGVAAAAAAAGSQLTAWRSARPWGGHGSGNLATCQCAGALRGVEALDALSRADVVFAEGLVERPTIGPWLYSSWLTELVTTLAGSRIEPANAHIDRSAKVRHGGVVRLLKDGAGLSLGQVYGFCLAIDSLGLDFTAVLLMLSNSTVLPKIKAVETLEMVLKLHLLYAVPRAPKPDG